jgi:hypothetical protein
MFRSHLSVAKPEVMRWNHRSLRENSLLDTMVYLLQVGAIPLLFLRMVLPTCARIINGAPSTTKHRLCVPDDASLHGYTA